MLNFLLVAFNYLLIGVAFAVYHLYQDWKYLQSYDSHLLYGAEEYFFICALWPLIAVFMLFFKWPIELWKFLEKRYGN